MIENRNTILAVILSGLVLIAWQYFYNIPTMEKQRAAQQAELAQKQAANPAATPATPANPAGTPATPGTQAPIPGAPATAAPVVSRPTAIAASPRVKIDTPSISGSISLTGARIDDVALVKYRETVDPKSPAIELFSPSGTKEPFYAEFGFVPSAGSTIKMPTRDTLWSQEGTGALTPTTPVTLTWNNGQGLTFKRTISIDDKYLFTIKDDVANVGDAPVTIYPFGLISRHGTPHVSGYYILHEGLIGVLGDQGLQEYGYKKMDETKAVEFKVNNAWMGITDKYWAGTLLPNPKANVQARFVFHGRASHAAHSPHLGRSALDAVELMNVGVNYMREHMPSDARIHYAIIDAGDAQQAMSMQAINSERLREALLDILLGPGQLYEALRARGVAPTAL